MRNIDQFKRFFRFASCAFPFTLSLVMISFLDSCAPCYYAPSSQNVPLLKEQNDFNISGTFKVGAYTTG